MELRSSQANITSELKRPFESCSSENETKLYHQTGVICKPLRTRTVLGNLTNRLQEPFGTNVWPSVPQNFDITLPGSTKPLIKKRLKLTTDCPDCSLQTKRTWLNQKENGFQNNDSGYNSSRADEDSCPGNDSESAHHALEAQSKNKTVLPERVSQPKRLRCDLEIKQSDDSELLSKPVPEDSDIDRRPFKSKLACDIVRAAFADRVQLEELLAECRRADFAISAIDRSPVDRMMEATDYIVGIMAYEQIRETKDCFRVSDFLSTGKQPNLNADMLTTLADWLVEVQENFGLNHETIHLAWGLLYAYLDRGQPLARREIQLMACAAIMVACKHEERQMPHMSEFLYITDNAYNKEEFIEAERRLLVAIDFAVHRPNPYVFLRRYARVLDAHSGPVQFTSRFLLEAGMHSHVISLKRESHKAAAVLWLARVVLRNPSYVDWTHRADVRQLRHVMRFNPVARAFYIQYSKNQKCKIATEKENNIRSKLEHLNASVDSESVNVSIFNRSSSVSDTNTESFVLRHPGSLIMCESLSESSCDDKSISSAIPLSGCHSTPSSGCFVKPAQLANSSVCDDDYFDNLDVFIKADLEAMHLEEEQRQPLWPPILEHITGYKEIDLIPLALRYHTIALRLIAEVARGGRLAVEAELTHRKTSSALDLTNKLTHIQETSKLDLQSVQQCVSQMNENEMEDETTNTSNARCVSPGGHYLRRQSVSKYCSSDFLSVADAYPQLAFDNFVPHFPSVQCSDSCTCFVCVNLIRRQIG